MKILLVEDDLALSDVVSFTLRRAGFETITAHDGRQALERWQAESPDLVILDINLPLIDGFSVCRRIRSESETPIIILSVRNEDDDIVCGLELGADDYIVKPFSPRQLVARAEAVLRRTNGHSVTPSQVTSGRLTLDPLRLELRCGDRVLTTLTRLECRLLEVLMCNRGLVVPADVLIDTVWGLDGGDRIMLKQLIYRLRRKLEDDAFHPSFLETIAGVGYAFMPDGQGGPEGG